MNSVNTYNFFAGPPEHVLDSKDLERNYTIQNNQDRNTSGSEELCVPSDLPATSPADGALVQEEEQDEGSLKLHVYGAYWKAVGCCLAFMVILSLTLMQGKRLCRVGLVVNVSSSHMVGRECLPARSYQRPS